MQHASGHGNIARKPTTRASGLFASDEMRPAPRIGDGLPEVLRQTARAVRATAEALRSRSVDLRFAAVDAVALSRQLRRPRLA